MERIGILGGTGAEGRGIALRLAASGLPVTIGSRSEERARDTAASLAARLAGGSIEGVSNCQLVGMSTMFFLAVPFDHAPSTLAELVNRLKAPQMVVDVTVPLEFRQGPRIREDLRGESGAERLARITQGHCSFAATFKTLPADLLEKIELPLDCDEFLSADTTEDRRRLESVVTRIPGLRWLDAGPLHHCRALEAMTAMMIGINHRYKVKHGRYRVVGLERPAG